MSSVELSGKMILGAWTSTVMSMRSPMSATAAAAAMSMLVFAVNTPEVGVVGVEVGVEVVVGVVVGVVEVGGVVLGVE